MEIVLLLGTAQAVFISFFLFTNKSKSTSDYILAVWLLFTVSPLVIYYFNFDEYSNILRNSRIYPSWLIKINLPFFLGHGPLMYLYIISAINQKKIKLFYLLYFVPMFIFIILTNFIYDFNSVDKYNFSIDDFKYSFILKSFLPIMILLNVFFIYKSFKAILKHKEYLKNHSSRTDNIDILWLNTVVYINISFWVILIAQNFVKKYNLYDECHNIPLFAVSIFVFIISFIGFKRPNIFTQYNFDTAKSQNNNSSNENANKIMFNQTNEQVNYILEYVKNNKPYLDPQLSIRQLAKQIDIPAHQLSKILNENIGKNFFDFVNSYRIEEVKQKIIINKDFTIMAIANDCGFNSKSSFNRIFKNYTGYTPTQFLQSIKSQDTKIA